MKTRLDNKTIWCYIGHNKPNHEREDDMTNKELRDYLEQRIREVEWHINSKDERVQCYFIGKKEAYQEILERMEK